jgi:hypothetical protein
MVSKRTLEQFERLQRESDLIVEALRNVMPTMVVAKGVYRRPRLTVLSGGAFVKGSDVTERQRAV